MYELLNKPAAIKEVQKFLYVISDRVNNKVPRVAIDGIYGNETRNAVLIFQRLYDLEGDGTVDRITFDKMYILYEEARNSDLSFDYIITENGFPVKLGDQNNDVIYIHLLINELKKHIRIYKVLIQKAITFRMQQKKLSRISSKFFA